MTPLSAEEIQALTDAERVRVTRLQQFMAERSSFNTLFMRSFFASLKT